MPRAIILTIGNELVSGDVVNTNGSWLAQRLEERGVQVELIASVPDDLERIASFVQANASESDFLLVTGGLGGTPDDITREAIAAAFGVAQESQADVAERLRTRFQSDPEYAARWAELPAGSRAIENPLGGAPGFAIESVYVLPGLPSEMEAMFESVAGEFEQAAPIGSWRRTYPTTESRIVGVLQLATERHPHVRIGSYPAFGPAGSEVEVVVKSGDRAALAAATAWIEPALERATSARS